jgi:subfamily B ATP-binding cassette protein MsbA
MKKQKHLEKKHLKYIKRFLAYFKPHWKYVGLAGIFMLINVLLQLPMPLFTRYIIDNVLPGKNTAILNWVVLALLGFMIIHGFSDLLNGYYLTIFRVKVLFNVQLKLFQHVQNLSIAYFKNTQTGYLTSRLSSDVSNLHGLLANTLLTFVKNVFTFIVGSIVIFIFHWKLALISLIVLPFFVYSIKYFSVRIRNKSHEFQERFARVFGTIQESLSAIELTKLFQLENRNAGKLVNRLKGYIKTSIKVNLLHNTSRFITAFIGGLGPLLVLWYGGREVIRGELTLGTLVAFSAFLGYLYGPVEGVVNLNTAVQSSLASLERIFELFDIAPRIRDPEMPKSLNQVVGMVEFKEVTFSYETNVIVLNKINLTAEPGKTIALVGKSGAGKTSLVNLIPRFYDPQIGAIFIDGIDIKDVRVRDLRKIIGVVPQEVFLFNGSIKENIRCGKLNAEDEEIYEAAKLANAHEFIERFPQGYDSIVGERGAKLSGGEKQRVAIARAILRNPAILILDEATSDLDSESEKLIQQALSRLLEDRTTFVIAHRFSTILNADKIVVLDNKEKVAEGTHKELFDRCDYYKKLCLNQFIQKEGGARSPKGHEVG